MFTFIYNSRIFLLIALSSSIWSFSSDSQDPQEYFLDSYYFEPEIQQWIGHRSKPIMLTQESLDDILNWLLPRYEKKYNKADEKTHALELMSKVTLLDSAKEPLKTILTDEHAAIERYIYMQDTNRI